MAVGGVPHARAQVGGAAALHADEVDEARVQDVALPGAAEEEPPHDNEPRPVRAIHAVARAQRPPLAELSPLLLGDAPEAEHPLDVAAVFADAAVALREPFRRPLDALSNAARQHGVRGLDKADVLDALGPGALPMWLASAEGGDAGAALAAIRSALRRMQLSGRDAHAIVHAARAVDNSEVVFAVLYGLVLNTSLSDDERLRHLLSATEIGTGAALDIVNGALALRPVSPIAVLTRARTHPDARVRALLAQVLAHPFGGLARLAPPLRQAASEALCSDPSVHVRLNAAPLFWARADRSPAQQAAFVTDAAGAVNTWHLMMLLNTAPADVDVRALAELATAPTASALTREPAARAILAMRAATVDERHALLLALAAAAHHEGPTLRRELRDRFVENAVGCAWFAPGAPDPTGALRDTRLHALFPEAAGEPERLRDTLVERAMDLATLGVVPIDALAARLQRTTDHIQLRADIRAATVLSRPGVELCPPMSLSEATRIVVGRRSQTAESVGTQLCQPGHRAVPPEEIVRSADALCAGAELPAAQLAAVLALAFESAAAAHEALAEDAAVDRLLSHLASPRLSEPEKLQALRPLIGATRSLGVRELIHRAERLGMPAQLVRTMLLRANLADHLSAAAVARLDVGQLREQVDELSPMRALLLHVAHTPAKDTPLPDAVARARLQPLPRTATDKVSDGASAAVLSVLATEAPRAADVIGALHALSPTVRMTRDAMEALGQALASDRMPSADAVKVLLALLLRVAPAAERITESKKGQVAGTRDALAVIARVAAQRATLTDIDRHVLTTAAHLLVERVDLLPDPAHLRTRALATLERAVLHNEAGPNARLHRLPWNPFPAPNGESEIALGYGISARIVRPGAVRGPGEHVGGVVFVDHVRRRFTKCYLLADDDAAPTRSREELLWVGSGRLPELTEAQLAGPVPEGPSRVELACDHTYHAALTWEPAWWPNQIGKPTLRPLAVDVDVALLNALQQAARGANLGLMPVNIKRQAVAADAVSVEVNCFNEKLAIPAELGELRCEVEARAAPAMPVSLAASFKKRLAVDGLRMRLLWRRTVNGAVVDQEICAFTPPEGALTLTLPALADVARKALALAHIAAEDAQALARDDVT